MENNMEKPAPNNKKGIKFFIPLIVVVLAVLIGIIYWYSEYSKYISTDDAHVESDNVSISSKMLGRISKIYAAEGDTVKKGQLLVEIDSLELIAQKKQVIAVKEQANSSKAQAEAKYKYDQENVKVLEINFEKAKDDFLRAKSQIAGDVISKEQFDHIKKTYEAAKAQVDVGNSQILVSKSQINSAIAAIENSNAQINVIETQLNNTKLYSPIDGIIAKRWLLAGDIVQPGQSVFTVTNNSNLWIAVYLEETKLSGCYINQKALFTIDAFSDVTFTGKIYSIGSNTASQFSLIPANNASGNFTKVTQRVPIKISIDGIKGNGNLSGYKLLSGMSALVKIVKD
jgi:membrane fusion protein, multidrug efflux system